MLNNQKGVAHLLVVLLLLLALPIGIYLAQHPQIFKPRANEAPQSYAASDPIDPTPPPTPLPIIFKGEYFKNKNLSGSPVLVRDDMGINFNWGNMSPAAVVPRDNFSARWTSQVNFDGGRYRFAIRSDDGMRIYIDNKLLYNHWKNQSAKTREIDTTITKGVHTVKVEYYENYGKAEASVSWRTR